jgi:ATP-dependent DNA helicase RecQ
MMRPIEILNRFFGYESFRPPQEEIIETLVSGRNALVLMPTGSGKSLCYQIPAIARPGCGIVISPLIALMQNQVESLQENGIEARFLNSTLETQQVIAIEHELLSGKLDLLYLAPERLTKQATRSLLKKARISLFAVDEAHCVSQWGHDFRQDYLELELLAREFPEVPRVALTATADQRTRKEIAERLGLIGGQIFLESFDRSNIQYQISLKSNYRQQLLKFLNESHSEHSGIIYCLSRNKAEQVAEWLRSLGFDALPYHAGLSPLLRERHQGRFLKEEKVIIVATIAFGMGIDKPDVRFVAHLDLPKSIESYYQETGRAGRDGEPADAWMIYGLQDVTKLRLMVMQSKASAGIQRIEQLKLNALLGFCEITTCRRKSLLAYFSEDAPEHCGNCDNCLYPVETFDGTEAVQKAFSTVLRTRENFGSAHLVDVLLGKETEKVLRNNHHHLSVFGVGKDLKADQWKSVFRQLSARGYLKPNDEHGSLNLDREASQNILRGEETIELRRDIQKKPQGRLTKTALPDDIEIALWENLREKRRQLAEVQGVPPYVVFHDKTLQAMAQKRPKQLKDFSRLPGVGERKLEKYGLDFLEVINHHG